MRQKTHHITIVLSFRDTSSLQDLQFSPSGTAFFIFAASFTEWLVDPAVDPTGLVVVVIIVVIVIVIVAVAVVVVVIVVAVAAIFIIIVVVVALGKQPLEPFEGIVVVIFVVVTLSLDSFGRLRLDRVERSHEPHANIWQIGK